MNSHTKWISAGEYESLKREATDRIIKRQSRGNVSAQNGWYISKRELLENSRAADECIRKLRKAFEVK